MEVITFTINVASLYYASFVGMLSLITLAGVVCFKGNAGLYLDAIIRILILDKERG